MGVTISDPNEVPLTAANEVCIANYGPTLMNFSFRDENNAWQSDETPNAIVNRYVCAKISDYVPDITTGTPFLTYVHIVGGNNYALSPKLEWDPNAPTHYFKCEGTSLMPNCSYGGTSIEILERATPSKHYMDPDENVSNDPNVVLQ